MIYIKRLNFLFQESIDGFKKILNGELDHLPEVAFYMVGDIADVIEKADRLADES